MMKNIPHQKSEPLGKEFEAFVNMGQAAPSEETLEEIESRNTLLQKLNAKIGRDLVKSPSQLALFYLGLTLVGYAVSLIICAQWSVGFSPFAHTTALHLHSLPASICPLVCGAVFTGIPFLLSCLFLNRFQHRYLITRMWWFFALVPLVTTGIMLLMPATLQHSHAGTAASLSQGDNAGTEWIVLWTVAAIVTPFIFEAVVYFIVRPKRYRTQAANL